MIKIYSDGTNVFFEDLDGKTARRVLTKGNYDLYESDNGGVRLEPVSGSNELSTTLLISDIQDEPGS